MFENITKDQISALLKDKRHECGLTGGEVVQKLKGFGIEISDKSLWGYENGISQPAVPTFLALCKIYEIEDLISELDKRPIRTALDERERKLIRYFRLASPELQDAALRMLEPVEKESTASLVG